MTAKTPIVNIYVLVDTTPEPWEIRYVGITRNTLKHRLYTHLYAAKKQSVLHNLSKKQLAVLAS
jgi:hypothetical protein